MDMIRPFSGTGDVVAWIAKVKLVARLQKVDDVASFLPLYLEGDALALYLQLSEKDQQDVSRIEQKLKEAFSDSPFTAFGKLAMTRWEGESVDVYANELKRLGGLAGFSGDGLDRLVRLAFINGFSDAVSCELQQVTDILHQDLSDVIARARVLTSSHSSNVVATAASVPGNANHSRRATPAPQMSGQQPVANSFRGACYRCGGPHMARNCVKAQPIVCFKCDKEGHIARQCPNQGNA